MAWVWASGVFQAVRLWCTRSIFFAPASVAVWPCADGARLVVAGHLVGGIVFEADALHDKEVDVLRQLRERVAWAGVAGEDYRPLIAVDAIGQGVEVRLDVLDAGRRDLPVLAGRDLAGANVLGMNYRRSSGKDSSAPGVRAETQGMVRPSDDVVPECADYPRP